MGCPICNAPDPVPPRYHDVFDCRATLRRDVERLTKDLDTAYAASLRSDETHAETVRAVRARAEKAEAERDALWDERAWLYNITTAAIPEEHREHVDGILRAERERLDHLRAALTAARAQVERLRGALAAVVEEHAHRCIECDAIATWREAVDRGGRDKFWCDDCVWIPQKAISKGAPRYQPQRVTFADWFEDARAALADAAGEGEKDRG